MQWVALCKKKLRGIPTTSKDCCNSWAPPLGMLSLCSHVITKLNENTLRPQTVTFPSWLDVSCQVTEFGNTLLQITDYSFSFFLLYFTHNMQLFHANQRVHTFLSMGLHGISRRWNNMFHIMALSWRFFSLFCIITYCQFAHMWTRINELKIAAIFHVVWYGNKQSGERVNNRVTFQSQSICTE